MIGATLPPRPKPDRLRRLARLGRLQDTEDDHDRARRRMFAGVTSEALDTEKARWSRVGAAIADLARSVCEACAASPFCETRPVLDLVTLRLSESIDDQFDRESWQVVDAAARLAAGD